MEKKTTNKLEEIKIYEILSNYNTENAGVKNNLARILLHGELSGTGKLVILPVDQGFEHGPAQSFGMNPEAYDPEYHIKLAIDSGLSAFAAPLGMLEDVAHKYSGQIPLILKINSSTLLNAKDLEPDQAVYSSIKQALQLGCVGVGFTIYPGSDNYLQMVETIAPMIEEAKEYGLACVVWAYPRGAGIPKEHTSSLDITCYAAHMACLIGAHIVKVKLPTLTFNNNKLSQFYPANNIAEAINHVVTACFNKKRIVVFSGGPAKNDKELMEEIVAIQNGGGNGSIIGRNAFQRPRDAGVKLLQEIVKIYKNE